MQFKQRLFTVLSLFLVMVSPCLAWSNASEGIPDVAHFVYGIWDSSPLPRKYERTIHLWEEQGWEVKLWNREDIEQLLSLPEYVEYKSTYESLPRNIQRADFIRYLIILHEGGFYFDLDCPPVKTSLLESIGDMLPHSTGVFFVETITSDEFSQDTASLYPIRKGIPETTLRISNFAFGCNQGNPILKSILALATERCEENPIITCEYDVLYTTGPDCLTEVVSQELDKVNLIYNTYDYMHHLASHSWYHGKDR